MIKEPEISQRAMTIEDVARLAGVAKSTASAALNGRTGKYAVSAEKREAVLRAAQELNFEANPHAKRLSGGRDVETIGLFTSDIDAGVGMQKLRLIQLLLTRAGYNVPIYSSGAPEFGNEEMRARLMASIRLQQPRAIVAAYSRMPETVAELQRFQDRGGLVVTFGAPAPLECDQVTFDTGENTYMAARHLLELGHRDLGLYIDGAPEVQESLRYPGFTRALKEFGGRTKDDWLVHSGTYETGTLQEGGGVLLAGKFLSWSERPSAICVVNDASAAAFISTVGRAGVHVPRDVSVVGHDNLPIASIFPTMITTVSNPVQAMAAEVARLLLSRLSGEYAGPPRRVAVRGELIVRESTRPPTGSD